MKAIDTDSVSARYRAQAVNTTERRLLITNLNGTAQAEDLQVPPNCGGFGRIRHFVRSTSAGWPENPLPIDPAVRHLGLEQMDRLNGQVFQNAVCNWRCWYCYVPFDLLAANRKHSEWKTAGELIDLYKAEANRPPFIDLSGGQPDLVPEWIPWTMDALAERGLQDEVYLWSDDNLSNDYFWRYLTPAEIERVRSYKMYSKVCCFKGFDAESFAFNTKAATELFAQQFELFKRYLELGIDLYAYATITSPNADRVEEKIARFVDRLQSVHHNLPLRTIPLEIRPFSVVEKRPQEGRDIALAVQQRAIAAWQAELERRFSAPERARNIVDVRLSSSR